MKLTNSTVWWVSTYGSYYIPSPNQQKNSANLGGNCDVVDDEMMMKTYDETNDVIAINTASKCLARMLERLLGPRIRA